VEVGRVDRGQPAAAGLLPHRHQARAAGQGQQVGLAAGDLGLGPGHLTRLGQGHLPRRRRRPGGGEFLQGPGGIELGLGLAPASAAHRGQPVGRIPVAPLPVGPARRRPGPGQGSSGPAGLFRGGQLLGHPGAVRPRPERRVEGSQRRSQSLCRYQHALGQLTPPPGKKN